MTKVRFHFGFFLGLIVFVTLTGCARRVVLDPKAAAARNDTNWTIQAEPDAAERSNIDAPGAVNRDAPQPDEAPSNPASANDAPSATPLPEHSTFVARFSLHANVAIHQNDREGIEHLCCYGLRPAFALQRLSWTDARIRASGPPGLIR